MPSHVSGECLAVSTVIFYIQPVCNRYVAPFVNKYCRNNITKIEFTEPTNLLQ